LPAEISHLEEGKYGVPTNNETMALIWNADLFKQNSQA
jgi:ABC-type glycerol-3-phosphate transport system substrate-binding protein